MFIVLCLVFGASIFYGNNVGKIKAIKWDCCIHFLDEIHVMSIHLSGLTST
jgi:hypothetical protein